MGDQGLPTAQNQQHVQGEHVHQTYQEEEEEQRMGQEEETQRSI